MYYSLLNVPTFPDIMKFFDFCDWFQKKWVLLEMQEVKPLAGVWGASKVLL